MRAPSPFRKDSDSTPAGKSSHTGKSSTSGATRGPAPTGEQFGKFVRTEKLGAGGMGEVWKAWDTQLSRWVALKFLKGGSDDETLRFIREAQTAGRLNHPNIAAIHEVATANDRPFIAMQFVEGRTMKTFPRTDRKLLVRLIRDAAIAVQYAHEQGIVHRDLKPENLMVSGKNHHAYVLDFGLAKEVAGGDQLSIAGAVVGTPAFMAPEQARGESADARTDVYSMGATLYELLCDRKPFPGKSAIDTIAKLQTEKPKPLREIKPDIDADLEAIVLKCMEKDPARRFPTADALAARLDQWLKGEKAPTSWRLLYAAIGAGALIVVVLMGILLSQGTKTELPAQPPTLPSPIADARIKKLSTLWIEVLERKRDLRALKVPAAKAREALTVSVEKIEQFVKENPGVPQGRYLRARGLEYLGRLNDALWEVEEALRIDPAFTPAKTFRAILRLNITERVALGTTLATREAAPKRAEALALALPDLSAPVEAAEKWGLPQAIEDEVIRTIGEAMRIAFVRKDHPAAADYLAKAIETRHAEEFAALLAEFGRTEWVERAIEWAPGYARIRHVRVSNLIRQADYRGAENECDQILLVDPNDVEALVTRGSMRQALGRVDEAIKDFDEAIRLDATRSQAYCNRGLILMNRGNLDAAASDFDAALRYDSRMPLAHVNRGMIRAQRNDHLGAVADYDEAIRNDPTCAIAFNNRGYEYKLRDDRVQAMKDYDEAVRLDPKLVIALTNRGHLRQAEGNMEGAIEDFTETIRLSPRDAMGYNNRGYANHIRGDLEAAMRDYDEGLRQDPKYLLCWCNRAITKESRGDLAGAKADWGRALEVAPSDWPHRAKTEAAIRRLADLLAK